MSLRPNRGSIGQVSSESFGEPGRANLSGQATGVGAMSLAFPETRPPRDDSNETR